MIKTRYGYTYGVEDENGKLIWYRTKKEAKYKLKQVYTAKVREITQELGEEDSLYMANRLAYLTNQYKDYIK